ncbi:MAG: hydrogenase expression/formation protein HypE [Kiritimatiellia bacterium]|nr:hydrogenase expression/formation protein HypE [Kiritimatiellia bacterium]
MQNNDIVLLSHGGGGLRSRQLIRDMIVRHLGNPILNELDDGAYLSIAEKDLVFTTDSFVVRPLFFPGGDIGNLAVCGTVNDLAMMGAEPRYLSLGLILEEGLSFADLERVILSMRTALDATKVKIVTGDTKVVERGMGFGLFVNTAGIGVRLANADTRVTNARAGDVVIVTGPLGDHGAAVISCREGINLESGLVSDVAPLWGLLNPLFRQGVELHCLRDPTRGGLAAALCDIAESSRVAVRLFENELPVRKEVRGICSLLGLDPLNMACEGCAVIVCPDKNTETVLDSLRSNPLGRHAKAIGRVTERPAGLVILQTEVGGERIIEIPLGEDLPRIC